MGIPIKDGHACMLFFFQVRRFPQNTVAQLAVHFVKFEGLEGVFTFGERGRLCANKPIDLLLLLV